ncbi:MAG TPA: hypothetical protein DDW93_00780 [Firmicutes bacterium]|nr:hypothetical protein [Bacillota bacterium]
MYLIFLFVCGFLLVKVSLSLIINLLIDASIVDKNYRGETVPAALGLVFPLVLPFLFLFYYGLKFFSVPIEINSGEFFAFLFFTTGFGLLGLADDFLKNNHEKGFRQHLTMLWQGKLTSGGLKALFGLLFSLIFAVGVWLSTGQRWWLLFPHTLVGALAPNIVNLFDLRPGRAIKVFLLGLVILLLSSYLSKGVNPMLYLSAPVLGGVLAYFPLDLKGRGMLGDTGANFLGGVFGGLGILEGSILLWIILLIFVVLQIIAEKISFTKLIEKYSFLKFFDDLGRD